MSDEPYVIELKVETHPSGRWTLVARQGPGMFEQLEGDLRGNNDAASFYREVARRMAVLSEAGVRFTYRDMGI
jgi:hypothetical protein